MLKHIPTIIISFFLLSCSSFIEVQKIPETPPIAHEINTKEWKLVELRTDPIAKFYWPDGLVTLNQQGNLNWYDGANRLHSIMRIQGDDIHFESPMSTMRGTPPGFIPKDIEVGRAIIKINNYEIDPEGKLLLKEDDDVLMIFTPIPNS